MKKRFTLLILLIGYSLALHAQSSIKLVQFSTGYSTPLGIENCGDTRLFIVEQQGRIMICDSAGNRKSKPYLNITHKVLFGSERGLLGLAFDPGYATNGFFYVNYINKQGQTQISRFKVRNNNPNLADTASEKSILRINQPFANHNGGCMRFGPDGYLYIGMGDGGSQGDPNNNAQNPRSLLGKMLRIDVRNGLPYKIPPDNPFVDSSNYKPEIWAVGLRNPWRWSFDATSGAMVIADVGGGSWEEVNLELPGEGGKNYGWRCYEGNHNYNITGCRQKSYYNFPVYEYFHSDSTGDCSITGGFVYRGLKYASLYGKYIFTDYCSGIFRLLSRQGTNVSVKTALNGDDFAYTSFGEDVYHELYVCNKANGNIYLITDNASSLKNSYSRNKTTEQTRLSFFPNPSKGNINITYTTTRLANVTIRITNILGEQVYTTLKTVNVGANTWNIHMNILKGNYYLSVISHTGNINTQPLRIE